MKYFIIPKSIFASICILVSISCSNIEGSENKEMNTISYENKKIIENYFETFNQHNWETLYNMYSVNAQFKDPSLGINPIQLTKDDFVNKYSELAGMFPDLKDEVVNIYTSGDNSVIVEFIAKGNSSNGMALNLPICTVFKLENGKIVSDHTYYNNAE